MLTQAARYSIAARKTVLMVSEKHNDYADVFPEVSSPAVQRERPDVLAAWCYVNLCSLEITLTVTWVKVRAK